MNIYQENGYENRREYLQELADEHDLQFSDVVAISDSLGGSNEDFDGLVTTLEDYAMGYL